MTTFTALDFETANTSRNSICQVGICSFVDGVIVEEISILINPRTSFWKFTDIHGITNERVENCHDFSQVWPTIKHLIENKHVVAHNGYRFDFDVLAKTLQHYDLEIPDYIKIDTYAILKRSLAVLCEDHNIELNHHDALSDARACGKLYLMHLHNTKNEIYSTID